MSTTTIDCERAVQVLVTAFADDPLIRWLLPEPTRSPAAAQAFGPFVAQSAAAGELAVSADGPAVAVWLPVMTGPPEVADEESPPDLAAHRDRLLAFVTLTGQRHPHDREHLYLAFLGVAPDAQGHGLGSALLRARLARADADGVPTYLEASSARNRPLYGRQGFRDLGEPIDLPDGPRLWPMWREPAARA